MTTPSNTEGGAKTKKRQLYEVGDYITRDDWVKMKVVATIDGDKTNRLYGLWHPKKNAIMWETEFQLYKNKVKRTNFSTDKWKGLKSGQMVLLGAKDSMDYGQVIAVVGEAVMLSLVPMKRKEKEHFEDIAKQLEDLTDGDITVEQMEAMAGVTDTATEAYKTAGNKWFTFEQLEYMHWEPVMDE